MKKILIVLSFFMLFLSICSSYNSEQEDISSQIQATGESSCNPWDAVKIAYENDRPLVVFQGNFISCHWAVAFKDNVIFSQEWKDYSREHGIAYFSTYQAISDGCSRWGEEEDLYGLPYNTKDPYLFSEPFVHWGQGSGQFIVFRIKNYIDPRTINSYYSDFYSDGTPKTSVSIRYSYDKLVELKNILRNSGKKYIYIDKNSGEYDPSISRMNPRYVEISGGRLSAYTREISKGWSQQQFNSENAEFLYSSFGSHPRIRYLEGSSFSNIIKNEKKPMHSQTYVKYMLGDKDRYDYRFSDLPFDYTSQGFITLFEYLTNIASPSWLEGTSTNNVDNSNAQGDSREENWNCTPWSECSSIGRKTKTCIDLNNVGTTINKPIEVAPCKPCTPDLDCDWSECISGGQELICTDLNECNPEAIESVIDFRDCTGSCIENWTCTPNWSEVECIDGMQTRTCTDTESCGTIFEKPSEEQECSGDCTPNWTCTKYWSECIDGIQKRTCIDGNSCDLAVPFELSERNCYCIPNWVAIEEPCQANDTYTLWYNDTNSCESFSPPERRVELCDYNGDGIIGSISDLNGLAIDIQETSSETKEVKFNEGNLTRIQMNYNFSQGALNLKNIKLVTQKETNYGYLIIEGLRVNKTVLVDRLNENSNQICIKNNQLSSINEISVYCNQTDEFILDCPGQKNGVECQIVGEQFLVSGLTNSGVREMVSGMVEPEWNCSSWSECSLNGTSSRICKDINNNSPDEIETKNCIFSGCKSKWVCSDWGDCSNKQQERECLDFNECEDKKIEKRDCEKSNKSFIIFVVISIFLVLFIVVSYILINKKKQEPLPELPPSRARYTYNRR